MRSSILYIVIFVMAPFIASAQQNDDNAYAGRSSIFIYQAFEPASPAYPDSKGNTGFILQRHEKGVTSQWATVKAFHSPQNAGELMDNYQAAMKVFADNKSRFDPAEAWAKWKKYKTYDSLQNELAFAPAQMAFGILVNDSTVKSGKTYQYRILRDKEVARTDNNDASNWVDFPARINSPRPKFLGRRTERDAIILQWFIKPGFSMGGFNVYRAAGNEKEYHLISPAAISMQHNDSLVYVIQDTKVSGNEMYHYYIALVNSFGGGGNIKSDTISATVMDPQKLMSPQYIRTTSDAKSRAITLHYLLFNPGFIGSVHIMRSSSFDNDFTEIGINSARDTLFTDRRITPGKKYYYYLLMTDKMGRNSARSIKTFGLFQENINSSPARFVTADRVKGGIEITWKNPPDTAVLSGYYVCRRQGVTGAFERLTTLLPVKAENSYLDTSKNLQPSTLYSYSVVSENLSNVVSQNSVVAYIAPTETLAPRKWVTPKNVKAQAENNFVRLLWYDMRLVNKGQTFYNIYRKSDIDTAFKKIKNNYRSSLTSYLDTNTVAGVKYVYAIEGANANGFTSAQAITNSVTISIPSVKAPDVRAFSSDKSITIQWENALDKRIKSYQVYRYVRGEQPASIGRAKSTDHQFEDKNVQTGKTYYYYLVSEIDNTQVTSIPSNKIYASLKNN